MMDNMSGRGGARIAVVAPAVSCCDAISEAAADACRMLAGWQGADVRLLTMHCDAPGMPAEYVSGIADMLVRPAFLHADILLYHVGVHHPLFDALTVGNGHAKQVVHFHNVTPADLLDANDRPGIARAYRQMHNLNRADVVWGASETNLQTLREHGIAPAATEVMPLLVDLPQRQDLAGKRGSMVNLLFLGRFVRSKGVLELLRAVRLLRERGVGGFHLRLVGNQSFSSPAYVAKVRAIADELGDVVEFVGQVDDARRDALLRESHILAIPSYHEGFCKPVIEALRAGCVPVGFAAYNLPAISARLGRMVPPGDVAALASALGDLVQDIGRLLGGVPATLRVDAGTITAAEFDRRARAHTGTFERAAVEARMRRSLAALLAPAGPPSA